VRALFTKTPAGVLIPADVTATELLQKIKLGQPVWLDLVRARNTAFHRKWFALVGVGFEAWEPPAIEHGKWAGFVPEKDFESFRKDVTIMAGFYEVGVSITGKTKVTARSISFDKMSEDEFERLYSNTINVLLRLVLTNKTEAQLREWVDAVMRFDG
jgi:hypothetical protein